MNRFAQADVLWLVHKPRKPGELLQLVNLLQLV